MKRKLVSLAAALLASAALAAAPPPADPIAGNAQARVRVIIYQDLECPDCAQWHGALLSQILPRFGTRVAFEFRDYPLPFHLWSFNAALLARYFDTQAGGLAPGQLGMAWRDYCFTHQAELTPTNLLDRAVAWAAAFHISRAQLEPVFARQDLFARIAADQDLGKRDHLQHTPTVLLDGKEATTPEQLSAMLDQALAASGGH